MSHRMRFTLACLLATACFTITDSLATDVRGRIEAKSPGGVTIELRTPKSHAPVRKAVADREGRYYIADIPPGRYELVVNGMAFPIAVEQVAIQELPPIQLKS